ncbi:MAG: endolytic transglycosylase MltG, partial [Clostridiales Family XIII bacterium]|nr:endolytic transglycosylase MltG [Clostridiales Family XIII bacterium]
MADTRRHRKRRRFLPLIIVLSILVILIAGAGGAFAAYKNAVTPADPSDSGYVSFVVESGMGTSAIAEALEDSDLIRNAFFFKVHSKLTHNDGKYKAGTFSLARAMSVDEIMDALIAGSTNTDVTRFTVPEGSNILQTARILAENGLVDEASFLSEAENGAFDYAFLADAPTGPERLEGFLYPETYEVYNDADAHEIIDKMLSQFDKLFLPEYYDRAAEMDMPVREIVTLASLIERESKTA